MNPVDRSTTDPWFEKRFAVLPLLAWMALGGVALVIVCMLLAAGTAQILAMMLAAVLLVPLIFWLVVVPIWHWRERYRGDRSDLWGALLVIETTGWFKIVYWFRHVIPDWRHRGRYNQRNGGPG